MSPCRQFLYLLVFGSIAAGEEKLSPGEKAARDFSFEKTKMGGSSDDFLRRYPRAHKHQEDSNPKWGLIVYSHQAESADVVLYAFLDWKLYEMQIIYKSREVEKIGGFKAIHDRVQEKFGKPLAKDAWLFDSVDRFIWLMEMKDEVRLIVSDTKLSKVLAGNRSRVGIAFSALAV